MADPSKITRGGLEMLRLMRDATLKRWSDEGFDVSRPWYHGTSSTFSEFKPNSSHGIWFSNDPDFANYYSIMGSGYPDTGSPQIHKVFIRTKNPLTYDTPIDFSSPEFRKFLSSIGTPEHHSRYDMTKIDEPLDWAGIRGLRGMKGRKAAGKYYDKIMEVYPFEEQGALLKGLADVGGFDSFIRDFRHSLNLKGDALGVSVFDPDNIRSAFSPYSRGGLVSWGSPIR